MRVAVVTFPGSNCDEDCVDALQRVLGYDVVQVWHKETVLPTVDAIVLPGGFSYGDYLRAGAIARFAPIIPAICQFAANGGFVVGICNGFQILLEADLLPGAMQRNSSLSFLCKEVHLTVDTRQTPFTSAIPEDVRTLRIPIAHMEGNYTATPQTLAELEREDQILFRYCTPEGDVNPDSNPNGSQLNIAGICNRERNVFGLMPHPERASEALLGSEDGAWLFRSLASHVEASR